MHNTPDITDCGRGALNRWLSSGSSPQKCFFLIHYTILLKMFINLTITDQNWNNTRRARRARHHTPHLLQRSYVSHQDQRCYETISGRERKITPFLKTVFPTLDPRDEQAIHIFASNTPDPGVKCSSLPGSGVLRAGIKQNVDNL